MHLKKNSKDEKIIFIWEISVCDELAYCFWVCGEAEYHGREHLEEQRCLPHGSKETEKKSQDSYPIQEYVLQLYDSCRL